MECAMQKTLLLCLCLLLATPAFAKPATNLRVGGGMLMGIGVPLAIIGLANIGAPPANYNFVSGGVALGIGLSGVAMTGTGAWLWVKGGERQEVALSWRF
jgi:hypothetical protein